MNQIKSYYHILGIPEKSGLEEIKRAYCKLALQHHPDQNNSSPKAEAVFEILKHTVHYLSFYT